MKTLVLLCSALLVAATIGGVAKPAQTTATPTTHTSSPPSKWSWEVNSGTLKEDGEDNLEELNTSAPSRSPSQGFVSDIWVASGNATKHKTSKGLSIEEHQILKKSSSKGLKNLKIKVLKTKEEEVAKKAEDIDVKEGEEADEKEVFLETSGTGDAAIINEENDNDKFDPSITKISALKHKDNRQDNKEPDTSSNFNKMSKVDEGDITRNLFLNKPSDDVNKSDTSFPVRSKNSKPIDSLDEKKLIVMSKKSGTKEDDAFKESKTPRNEEMDLQLRGRGQVMYTDVFHPFFTPEDLVKPYYGPLARVYVLPSGYLADTDEVFAARQRHLKALAEAESAAEYRNEHTI